MVSDFFSGGFLMFYRRIIVEPVWIKANLKQRNILITLMCMANYKSNTWEYAGETISLKPGEMITSVQSIIEKCANKDITRQAVRSALLYFQKNGIITYKTTKNYTRITILEWLKTNDIDDTNNQENNYSTTTAQPSYAQNTTNYSTTNNKYNNYNKYNKYNNNNNNRGYYKPPNAFCDYTQEHYTDEQIEQILERKAKEN